MLGTVGGEAGSPARLPMLGTVTGAGGHICEGATVACARSIAAALNPAKSIRT